MLRSTVFRLQRRSGVCTKWTDKGFGFIQDNADQAAHKIEQFVHHSAIQAAVKPHKALRVGEQVEFELETGKNGRRECVRVSGPGGAPVEGVDQLPPRPQGGGPPRDGGNRRH